MGLFKNLFGVRKVNIKIFTPSRDDFSNAIHNYMIKNPNVKLNQSKLWEDYYKGHIDYRLTDIEKYIIK